MLWIILAKNKDCQKSSISYIIAEQWIRLYYFVFYSLELSM